MIEKYLALCPREFTIMDRKGNKKIINMHTPPSYFTSLAIHYLRGQSKNVTEIGENELIEFTRVVDHLENVYGIVGTGLKEYPPKCVDFTGFKLMAQYSSKHLRPVIFSAQGAEAIMEMADVILEGKPLKENMFFSVGFSIANPLTWSETSLDVFYNTRGYGIPVMINSGPMVGGTSPVTLAGCVALANAGIISGIVINQVIEPGRPCIYNAGFAHVFDMRTMQVLSGAPENALLQVAGAEMAKFHNLPCASRALSDALMMDSQASYEKMMTLLSHTMANINFVWGVGNIETSMTLSPEVAVLDNEMIGNCQRFCKGIIVDKEHIALDLIREVSFKNSYLETDHTLRFFKEEIRHSYLPNRTNRVAWQKSGSKSIEEKACDVVKNILNKKADIYLTGSQINRLEKIQEKYMRMIHK